MRVCDRERKRVCERLSARYAWRERERERERERVCVCVRARERENACVCSHLQATHMAAHPCDRKQQQEDKT
jgi:hypothetical protein